MAKKSVRLEDKFIDLAYEVRDMEGLGKEEVKEYKKLWKIVYYF